MPNGQGVINTYSQVADDRPRLIGEKIWLNGVQDIALMNLLGPNSADGKFNLTNVRNSKIEWITTGLTPRGTTITTVVPAPVTTGDDINGNPVYPAVTIGVTNAEYFHRGQLLYTRPPAGTVVPTTSKADGYSYHWVQSVDCVAGTITVLSGFLGTDVYDTAIGDEICVLSNANVECAEYQDTFTPQRALLTNHYQMFTDYIQFSEKELMMDHIGIANLFDFEMRRIMGGMLGGQRISGTLPKDLENALWYGIGQAGGTDYPATMHGINNFGIQNFTESALTRELIERVSYSIYKEGSNASDIIVGGNLMQEIANWYDPYIRTPSLKEVGGSVMNITTAYGSYKLTHHRGLRSNEIYFLDKSKIGVDTLQEFTVKPLSTNGFCDRWGISGYYTLALAVPCHHARIVLDSACFPDSCVTQCDTTDYNPPKPPQPGVVAP